jgi:hypothetical protein
VNTEVTTILICHKRPLQKLLLFFILASSINSAAKVEVVTNELMFSHDKGIECEFKVVKKNSEYNPV